MLLLLPPDPHNRPLAHHSHPELLLPCVCPDACASSSPPDRPLSPPESPPPPSQRWRPLPQRPRAKSSSLSSSPPPAGGSPWCQPSSGASPSSAGEDPPGPCAWFVAITLTVFPPSTRLSGAELLLQARMLQQPGPHQVAGGSGGAGTSAILPRMPAGLALLTTHRRCPPSLLPLSAGCLLTALGIWLLLAQLHRRGRPRKDCGPCCSRCLPRSPQVTGDSGLLG